jgi:cell division protein FtsN
VASAARPAERRQNGCGNDDAHFVQVAAFGETANAQRVAASLERLGRVEIEAAALNRVRLGPYASRRDAFGKLAVIRGLGYQDAQVISCS